MTTAPEKANANDKSEPVTRGKEMLDRGEEPDVPLNPAEYLTEWLFDIGPSNATEMGETPLAIRHVEADMAALGIEAEPWELRLLRRLSKEWIAERHRAQKRDCPPPYLPPGVTEDQFVENKVNRQVSSIIAAVRSNLRARSASKRAAKPRRVAKGRPTR